MKILLNHPVREVEVKGPRRVREVLKELNLLPESVLVVRGDDLVTEDELLKDEDRIEIRPVISGGYGDAVPQVQSESGAGHPTPPYGFLQGVPHGVRVRASGTGHRRSADARTGRPRAARVLGW